MKKTTILTLLCVMLFAAHTSAAPIQIGGSSTWYEITDGTITITGTGAMPDFGMGGTPWNNNLADIKTVVIESGVTTIGANAFEFCDFLTSVTLPEGITAIGDYAFSDCYQLPSINLPASLQTLGEGVFGACGALDISVAAGSAVYSSVDGVLMSKDGKTLLIFPAGKKLLSYEVPDGVETIGTDAFSLNQYLREITLPASVRQLEHEAFDRCKALVALRLGAGVESIGAAALYACNNLQYIFAEWTDLSGLRVDPDVFGYGGRTSEISTVHVPAGSETVYKNDAFWGQFDIVSGQYNKITYKHGDADDFSVLNPNPDFYFQGTELELRNGEPHAYSYNDAAYDFRGWYADAQFSVRVNSIAATAASDTTLYGKWRLAEFHYDGLYCVITSFDQPCEVEVYGSWLADSDEITIPEKFTYNTTEYHVTSIGELAFADRSNLTAITIPASVTNIGGGAFMDCTALTSVTVLNPTPSAITLGDNIFDNVPVSGAVLTVPTSSLAAYKDAPVWRDFGEIQGGAESSIGEASASSEEVAGYYSLMGRKLTQAPESGMYITKVSHFVLFV